jgi:cobalamin biosynthetic protein CobC
MSSISRAKKARVGNIALQDGLAPLLHGGDLASARHLFPDAPEPFLDLSTGINPHAYPIPRLAPEAFKRLPEPGALERLAATAAVAYGAPSGAHVTLVGHEVEEVREIARLREASLAIVVNPNNPDGRVVERKALLALAAALAQQDGLLVLDEAFMDASPGKESLCPNVDAGNIVVLRSFSKFFGLAGLRLGFAVAATNITARLQARLGPWAASGPAIAVGEVALADRTWQQQTRARLAADAHRLEQILIDAGFAIVGGTSLFRLVRTPAARDYFDRLGRAGILVRRFNEQPQWLRFGLPGDEAAWQRLCAALGPQ